MMHPDEQSRLDVSNNGAGEKPVANFYSKLAVFLESLGIPQEGKLGALEIWQGIAECLADVSGYRVLLEAGVFNPDERHSNSLHLTEYRPVAAAEPAIFVQPYEASLMNSNELSKR